MIVLKYPPYPSPFWFRGEKDKTGVVTEVGTVYVEATKDNLLLVEGTLPPVGATLFLTPDRFDIKAETEIDSRARREEQARQRLTRQEEERQQKAALDMKLMQQAQERNARLYLPVRWTSGFKSVISGLTENSSGNGINRRTVIHVLLLEDIRDGRLVRNEGDFLCTAAGGSNGKLCVNPATHSDGEYGPYVCEITCKQCIKAALRWQDKNKAVPPECVP